MYYPETRRLEFCVCHHTQYAVYSDPTPPHFYRGGQQLTLVTISFVAAVGGVWFLIAACYSIPVCCRSRDDYW